jgi:hypothetical protein
VGIVEHDEDASSGQVAAVEPDLRVQIAGDSLRGDVEGVEEPADGLRGWDRGRGWVEAAEVDVELSVREAVADAMGPVHGEGGPAHASLAAQGRDDHRCRLLTDGPPAATG